MENVFLDPGVLVTLVWGGVDDFLKFGKFRNNG
jgi:hypothetical protein